MKWRIISILCLLSFSIQAQQGFIKGYALDSTHIRFTDMVLSDDTLIVSGIAVLPEPPYIQSLFFAKIDTNGILLDHKIHLDSQGADYSWTEPPFGLIKVADNSGYILLAHIFQRKKGTVIKLDNDGNLLWAKEYPYVDQNGTQEFFKSISEAEDGFVIAGQIAISNTGSESLVFKIDKEGNRIWGKVFGSSTHFEAADDILILNNNEYVVGGRIGSGLVWQEWHNQVHIFAIDSLGNEKWYWESNPPFDSRSISDARFHGLHRDEHGNWVYATLYAEFLPDNDGSYWRQAVFVKRDSLFNLLEERKYDELDNNYFLNVIPLADKDWLTVGANYELTDEGNPNGGGKMNAWSARMEANGDTVWTRNDLFRIDNAVPFYQILHSGVELPSGNIILAGYIHPSTNGSPFPDHGILIKVNQHGCIDTISCIPTNTTSIKPLPPQYSLKVYPNPVHDILYFESDEVAIWDKVELLDYTGKLIKKGEGGNRITMHDLPTGIYLLRLWKDGFFWTRRVVQR